MWEGMTFSASSKPTRICHPLTAAEKAACGEKVVQKGVFGESVSSLPPQLRFALKTLENLKGAEKKWALQKRPLGRPFLRLRRGGVKGEGKTGSICHFAFYLVLQCLGMLRYPDAGKNSTKNVIATPLFVCAPNAGKN